MENEKWKISLIYWVLVQDGFPTSHSHRGFGETLGYSVKANIITLANNDGAVQLPFQLSGDTLRVQVGERTVVYKRLTGEQGSEAVGPAAGANPPRVIR